MTRARIGNRLIEIAETVVYAGIAVLLLIAAIAVLIFAARRVPHLFGDDADGVALELLDTLLLVFIVVELLFAVRTTIAKRELIAEPFLIVGIIASIKEIVVLAVRAAESASDQDPSTFHNQMLEIGVLGLLVLLLGITALLLRRKEREPGEGDNTDPDRPAPTTA